MQVGVTTKNVVRVVSLDPLRVVFRFRALSAREDEAITIIHFGSYGFVTCHITSEVSEPDLKGRVYDHRLRSGLKDKLDKDILYTVEAECMVRDDLRDRARLYQIFDEAGIELPTLS